MYWVANIRHSNWLKNPATAKSRTDLEYIEENPEPK